VVAGFGGMRDYDGQLLFNPQLPDGMTRLAFSVRWQDMRLKVEIRPDEVIYSITDGPDGHVTLLQV